LLYPVLLSVKTNFAQRITMKNWSCLLLTLLLATGAQAQMYKWTGADGKVTYSDTPPPNSARHVEEKALGGDDMSNPPLPFELARAVKAYPVTLYTTKKCEPCEEGRSMLQQRGIPYTEKTVNTSEELAKFRALSDKPQFPLLTVGSQKHQGFQSIEWDAMLTAAAYPQTSMLPKDYKNPTAQSIAPKPPVQEKAPANDRTRDSVDEVPPATGNAPPGFRF
jgi:glutaredoxin